MSDKIAQAQSGEINETQRMLDKMPEESAEIISKYQEKLEKENAMIISSKNRYEINEQLQEFNSLAKIKQDNTKVEYIYPDNHP